ncbi:protease inhibitor I42 family protein [Usitatibacter palustris]|uniref:Proteinase inhibitor I42 chagasin domain-containing protein n=1 Tax=Usitatibacter palustris TaxID=2732487 RepID=A0A6M4H9R1_9PROT|nr:protease inhibitor I42 family protein [Usitatibacter palustris]QJR15992.1 hypothetical protein DSM104440_02820 [Usitatibacter palustris]
MIRRPFLALLLAFLPGILLAAANPDPVTVTLADSAAPVELIVGQELRLRLESNPSTGYAWAVAKTSKHGGRIRIVKQKGESKYEAPPAPADGKPVVGAQGVEVWTFTAAKPGSQQLKLEYRRGWEKDVAPAKTATFKITVREAPKK